MEEIKMESVNSQIIKDLITSFKTSTKYQKMIQGQKYYKGKHDILKKPLNKYYVFDTITKQQIEKTNNNKSNIKLIHKFHKKLVNQKIAYILGKPLSITCSKDDENKTVSDAIWESLGIKFENLIKNKTKDASNQGLSWIHPEYDKSGKLVFKSYPATEIIPIYDTETETELRAIIHFYKLIDVANNNEEKIYVEYWTDKGVRFYIETKQGETSVFLEDVSRPRQDYHYITEIFDSTLNEVIETQKHNWGKVPFIKIVNNEEETTDLEDIKGLIDAYDLIDSNYVNTVEDLKEIIWLINGYGAEDVLALIEAIKVNGVARNNDATGSIDAKTIAIPYEAREALLKKLKEHIYEFGRGVDTSNREIVAQAPSGVALDFLYNDLDLKADDIIPSLRIAIYEILWYVLDDLKRAAKINSDITLFDFEIEFNKTRIFNENELMTYLSNDTLLSTLTKLKLHPKVQDADAELKQINKEKADNLKIQQQVFNNSGGFEDKHGDE